VFAEQALELSQKIEELSCYSKFIKQLSIVQPQNAAYSKEYIQINDSLQSGAKNRRKFTY
jgi:hypothetical protein